MTPKEKAIELHTSMKYIIGLYSNTFYNETAKQCAKECVEKIIEELDDKKQYIDDNLVYYWNIEVIKFWEDVLKEIEIL